MIEQKERIQTIGAGVLLEAVNVYTDGSCIGNPGPGGYAAIMLRGQERRVIRGGDFDTTNNRMELMGAILALESMKTAAPVIIHSDSQYVINGMTKWLRDWKSKGWKTSDGKAVKNRDLWERLEAATASRPNGVMWIWVRGHDGHIYNEEAHCVASAEAALASCGQLSGN